MASTRQTTRTPRSIHTQHRDRALCAGQKARLLDLLLLHSPEAAPLDDLRAISSRLSARIDELRSEGWSIETIPGENRVSTYRLTSRVQGSPLVIAAAITIHVPVGREAQVKTHERLSDEYTQDRLAYAARKAVEAYVRALGRSEAPAPKVKNIDDDLDLDGGVW